VDERDHACERRVQPALSGQKPGCAESIFVKNGWLLWQGAALYSEWVMQAIDCHLLRACPAAKVAEQR